MRFTIYDLLFMIYHSLTSFRLRIAQHIIPVAKNMSVLVISVLNQSGKPNDAITINIIGNKIGIFVIA